MTPEPSALRELELRLARALYPGGEPRRPDRLRRRLAPIGALVAAAVAALAILAVAGGGRTASSAAAVLDRAARTAAQAPPPAPLGSGQFWYTRDEQVGRFPVPVLMPVVRPRGAPPSTLRLPGPPQLVWVTQRSTTETWIGRSGTIRSRRVPVGAPTFATAADRARFAASGLSPSEFLHPTDATTQGDGYFPPNEDLFQYSELLRLPTDPHALYARVSRALALAQARARREFAATQAQIRASPTSGEVTSTIAIRGSQGAAALWAIKDLLESPVPAPVRAALYRAAALIPGVRLARNVRDPLGRTGVGIATGPPPTAFELILDPTTGALLGQRSRIGGDSATLTTGVVNSIDALPAGVAAIAGPARVPIGVTPAHGTPGTTFAVTVAATSAQGYYAFNVIGPVAPLCRQTLLPGPPRMVPSPPAGRPLNYRLAPPDGSHAWCRGSYQVFVSALGPGSRELGTVRFRVG